MIDGNSGNGKCRKSRKCREEEEEEDNEEDWMEEAAFGATKGPRDGLQNLVSAAAWWHHGRKGLDCKNLVKGESDHTNHEVDESGR